MSLNKDRSITELVEALDIDDKGWSIRDHWDGDLCAIGITSRAQPDRLVYVSTFELPAGQYFYECEVESSDGVRPFVATESARGVELGILDRTMIEYLGIKTATKPKRQKSLDKGNRLGIAMPDKPARDDAYCAALEQITQMLAKYRPDVTNLHGDAVLSPRILMLLIERSESQIPADIFGRLRPLAQAVLNRSELGIAEMVESPVPDELQSEIRTVARSAYEAIGQLHVEVMKRP